MRRRAFRHLSQRIVLRAGDPVVRLEADFELEPDGPPPRKPSILAFPLASGAGGVLFLRHGGQNRCSSTRTNWPGACRKLGDRRQPCVDRRRRRRSRLLAPTRRHRPVRRASISAPLAELRSRTGDRSRRVPAEMEVSELDEPARRGKGESTAPAAFADRRKDCRPVTQFRQAPGSCPRRAARFARPCRKQHPTRLRTRVETQNRRLAGGVRFELEVSFEPDDGIAGTKDKALAQVTNAGAARTRSSRSPVRIVDLAADRTRCALLRIGDQSCQQDSSTSSRSSSR